MRPIIGLIPLYDDDKDSYWMLPGYMKVIEKCGGLPVMLPLTDDKAELNDAYKICDGILFTGGHDVSPFVYGQEATDKCGIPCSLRDSMEGYMLDLCIRDDKPLLGICRGIQFINAHLGGTLYQDLFRNRVHQRNIYDMPDVLISRKTGSIRKIMIETKPFKGIYLFPKINILLKDPNIYFKDKLLVIVGEIH